MTEDTMHQTENPSTDEGTTAAGAPFEERALARLEARIAQAEAQLVALGDRVAELHAAAQAAKQRGLWLRVLLLLAALAAFFVIRSQKGG